MEPGEIISPEQARAPAFLLDKSDLLIVVDQSRSFLLGRFTAPPGLSPESPGFPGGVGLERIAFEGPPLPSLPLTPLHQQHGFPFMCEGAVAGSPCILDLDLDGTSEVILATTEGTVHVLTSDGESREGWPIRIDDGFYAPPAAGDLDGNGFREIVLGGISGRIYAWRVDGSLMQGWPVQPALTAADQDMPDDRGGAGFFGAAALADVDGDGASEVCIAAGGKVWLFRGSGECLPGWPQQLPHATQPSNPPSTFAAPAVGDIDADGVPEILLASNACQIHAWTISGSILDGWPAPVPHRARAGYGGIALGDVTGDGRPEIVVTSEHGFSGPATITVLDARGRPVPNWPYILPDACNAGAALGDLTGDGILEIVTATVGGDATILAIDGRSAQPLPGWPLRLRCETVNAAPLIVDLDGDGSNDILIAALSTGLESDAWIWAFDRWGEQLNEFPIMLPQDEIVCASPVTGDLDGDGDLELLAATERLNSVYVWDLNTLCDPYLMPWPGVAGGASRRGCPSIADDLPSASASPCPSGRPGTTGGPWTETMPQSQQPKQPTPRMDPDDLSPGTTLDGPPPGPSHNLWPPEDATRRPPGTAGLSTVAFDLRGETHVRLVIFDFKRHPIRRLLQHTLPPGQYRIYWDGRDAAGDPQPSGIYFYQLNLGIKAQTRQLLLLK